jgi:diguanylate cyclase (GGDEF)-like protein/PAS domain S-box-containing protein
VQPLERLPWRLYAYIGVVAIAAVAAAYALLPGITEASPRDAITLAVITALFGVCARFPLLLAPKYQQELSPAPGMAAAMLLPPPLALVACAFGQVAGERARKNGRPAQMLMNASVVSLQAGLAAAAFGIASGIPTDTGSEAAGFFAAGLVYFAVGVVLFEGIVSLQVGQRPFRTWRERHGHTARAEASLVFIGGLVSLIASEHPWSLPLMVVPIAIIYRAFFNQQTDLRVARASQEAAEAARERLTAIVNASPDFVATADAGGQLEYVNGAGRRMLGLDEGVEPASVIAASHIEGWRSGVAAAIRDGSWRGETSMVLNGQRYPVSQVIVAHRSPGGRVEFLSTIARDISELKAAEAQLVRHANHDALTGLLNRRHFEEALRGRARSTQGELMGVLFIDLDGFKAINDRYGHQAGDAMLQGIAATIRDRASRKGDVVARLGGDEFALLVERSHAMQVELAAHRIVDAVRGFRLELEGDSVSLGASVGVAMFRGGWADADEVIARADRAMYTAKQQQLGVVVAPEPEASERKSA